MKSKYKIYKKHKITIEFNKKQKTKNITKVVLKTNHY